MKSYIIWRDAAEEGITPELAVLGDAKNAHFRIVDLLDEQIKKLRLSDQHAYIIDDTIGRFTKFEDNQYFGANNKEKSFEDSVFRAFKIEGDVPIGSGIVIELRTAKISFVLENNTEFESELCAQALVREKVELIGYELRECNPNSRNSLRVRIFRCEHRLGEVWLEGDLLKLNDLKAVSECVSKLVMHSKTTSDS